MDVSYENLEYHSRKMEYYKGKFSRRYTDHTDSVTCSVMWRAINTGNLLITGSRDKTLRIWDLDNNSCINVLRGHSKGVTCVTASGDNAINPIIVSGGLDNRIIVWSILTGLELHRIPAQPSEISVLVLWTAIDTTYLFSASVDNFVRCWDIFALESMSSIIGGHSDHVSCLCTVDLPKYSMLISGGYDGLMKIWDMNTKSLFKILQAHSASISSVAVSPSAFLPLLVSTCNTGRIIVWELEHFEILYILQDIEPNLPKYPISGRFPFSPCCSLITMSQNNNPIILSSTTSTCVKVWDCKTGGLLRIIQGCSQNVSAISIGHCEIGPIISCGDNNGLVVLWSPEEDLLYGCENIDALEDISMEESLVHVGRYMTYWNMVLEDKQLELHDTNIASVLSAEQASTIFYCMMRMGHINPSLIRVYVNALMHILIVGMKSIDLLWYDEMVDSTPLQFLFDNRLCLPLAHEWMKSEKNIRRVIYTLTDRRQSSETLDSILSSVLGNERLGGWNMLLSHSEFKYIFWNLMLYAPRSHGKIASLLRTHGLGVELDPYPSPLGVRKHDEYTVVRWAEIRKGTGIYCYRIRVNNLFPTDMLLSRDFFTALSESEFLELLAGVPLIEYVVQYKWESWGHKTTIKLACINLVYLLTTTVSVLSICAGDDINLSMHPFVVICIAFSLLCNSIQMALAMWQFGTTSHQLNYVKNLWNVSDIIMIVLCHLSIILGAGLGPIYVIRVLCTLLTLVLWGRIIYFGRGEKGLAILIYTMKNVIWDVRYFLGLMFIFVAAYSISFKVLGVFDSLFISFLLCVNMMLGDVGFSSVRGQTFPEMLYLSFLVMVAIIMLNAFIAFIQGSLDKSVVKKEIAPVISRVKMIHELELKMLPIENFMALFSGKKRVESQISNLGDLVILVPEHMGKPNLNSYDADTNVIRRMDNVTTYTMNEFSHLKNAFTSYQENSQKNSESLELRMSKLEYKFDHIISMLSKRENFGVRDSGHVVPPVDNHSKTEYSYFGEED